MSSYKLTQKGVLSKIEKYIRSSGIKGKVSGLPGLEAYFKIPRLTDTYYQLYYTEIKEKNLSLKLLLLVWCY